MGGGVEFFEGLDRDQWPGVLREGFAGCDQFTQVVGVAPGVGPSVVLIGLQSVVDGDAVEPVEYPEVVHRLTAALAVGKVRGEVRGAGDVQPPGLAFDWDTGLVDVRHRRQL
nr:hypothetical protein [Amycolatopsis sp.]